MKEQLVFDTTDATTIEHSDSVGAYVRASDGTLIDKISADVERLAVDAAMRDSAGNPISSTGGAVDVNIASGISLEVDLDHTEDSVRLGDGVAFFTSTSENGDIALDVHISNASIVVTATQLDIDDLNATDDHVSSYLRDGAGTELTSTLIGADQALDVNMVNDITVSDAALAETAIAAAALTLAVANTAQDVVAAPLADRKYLHIMNMDNKRVYIGQSGVSSTTGYPLSPSASIMLRAGAAVDIEFVGSTGATPEVRTLELS